MTILEHTNYLDQAQHGFPESRSTVAALIHLKRIIKDLLKEYKYCSMAALHIQKTFDAVDWLVISEIVDELEISYYLKSIIKNYISKRENGY